jgi:hypothetical protein
LQLLTLLHRDSQGKKSPMARLSQDIQYILNGHVEERPTEVIEVGSDNPSVRLIWKGSHIHLGDAIGRARQQCHRLPGLLQEVPPRLDDQPAMEASEIREMMWKWCNVLS